MHNHANLRVHDRFYADPHAVRRFAMQCTYRSPPSGTFPGYHSSDAHPDARETLHRISGMIRAGARPDWERIERIVEFWGWPAAGLFTLLTAGQADTIHFHRRSGRWAAVIYLSLPEHCSGRPGVTFYRHRATGLDTYLGADADAYAQLRADADRREAWEPLVTVPMEFNRLVIFDASYLHAASTGFEASAADGRLAQIFTFNLA